MELSKLSDEDLSELIIKLSKELEDRKLRKASQHNTTVVKPTQGQILKPATPSDHKHPRTPEDDVTQPALKKLKGVKASNRYECLSIDDDFEDSEVDEDMSDKDVSDEDIPTATDSQNTENPRSYNKTIHAEPPKGKIPPIVLHQKELWTTVSKKLSDNKISFSKAKTIADGISIQPSSSSDYRSIIKILDDIKAQYHTYQLPSEKLLHVVLRGVPEPLKETEIRQELEESGFHPETISRLRRYRDKSAMPLVLVTVPKTEKNIFNLKHVNRVVITVESQRPKTRVSQCFRCQRFGHAQSRCTVKPRCVKCAGDHHYSECNKDKNTPPKCANCGENHTASYRGCSKWPQLKKTQASKQTTEGVSYAKAAKSYTETTQNNMSLTELFTSFQAMYSQMQEIAKKLSEMFTTSKPST